MNTLFLLPSGYRVGWPGSSQRQSTLPKPNETLQIILQSLPEIFYIVDLAYSIFSATALLRKFVRQTLFSMGSL